MDNAEKRQLHLVAYPLFAKFPHNRRPQNWADYLPK